VVRRDYFEDAATLFALDQSARDEEIPDWAQDPQSVSEAKPRRRRRRRRRRGND